MGMVHRLFGIATALVVVLVNSIAMTYFVGTSRWCREVVETYQLDAELVRRSAVLKRRAFPWAVVAMLVIVGVSAWARPPIRPRGIRDRELGYIRIWSGAICGLAFIAWAFWQEWLRIAEHHVVITEILGEVKRIRQERGLEVIDEDRFSCELAFNVSAKPASPSTGEIVGEIGARARRAARRRSATTRSTTRDCWPTRSSSCEYLATTKGR